ncbi:MAG: DUF2934 domain-containing protein [Thermodesulfovibrionales bacterium]|jgi:outer membrane biosynthesis protein TonB
MGIYDDFAQEITRLAYEIYERNGRIEGRDMENWLEAERIVMAMCAEEQQATEPFAAVTAVAAAEALEEELETEALAGGSEPVPAQDPAAVEETTMEELPLEPWPVPEQEKAAPKRKPAKKAAEPVKQKEKAEPKPEEKKAAVKAKKTAGGKTKTK